MNFAQRLKEIREGKKMTQKEIAKLLNLKPTAISNYEAGKNEPSIEKLQILAKSFGVSLDYLLGTDDNIFSDDNKSIDKDVYELSCLYNMMDKGSREELKKFAEWLIYKQK